MVSNIVKIFLSELKLVFKDEGSFLIMAFAIVLYSAFYTIPFAMQTARNVPIGVIDNDNSAFSRELIRDLNATEYVQVVKHEKSIEEATNDYYKNTVRAFVLIPKDFEKNIKQGKPSFISSYLDSSFLIIYKQVVSAVSQLAKEAGTKIEVKTLMQKGLSKDNAIKAVLPFEIVQNPLYNPIGSYQNYVYPLVLVLILHQTMIIGVNILGCTVKEKMNGMFIRADGKKEFVKIDKFNEFSDNPLEIVLGKSCAYVLPYLIYASIYFLIMPSFVVYQMNYSHLLTMFSFLLLYLFTTSFFAQSLILLFPTRESSFFVMVASSLPLMFLTGFIWAKESIMPIIFYASKLIPFITAADGMIKINQMGADFSDIYQDFIILLVLCAVYFCTACMTVKTLQKQPIHTDCQNSEK